MRLTQFPATQLSQARLHQLYGIPVIDSDEVLERIKSALRTRAAFSLVRGGDIDADVLAHDLLVPLAQLRFAGLSDYVGLPRLPSPQLRSELARAFREADVTGVLDLAAFRKTLLLRNAFRRLGITPREITSALVMRELYLDGRLLPIVKGYRLHLIGRQAKAAAEILRQRDGMNVVGWTSLEGYPDVERVFGEVRAAAPFDVLLIGAATPGRLLCPRLARERRAVVLDVGHVLDEIVHPGAIGDGRIRSRLVEDWRQSHRKKR